MPFVLDRESLLVNLELSSELEDLHFLVNLEVPVFSSHAPVE